MDILIVVVLRGYERELIGAKKVIETTLENVEEDTVTALQGMQREGYGISSFSVTKL